MDTFPVGLMAAALPADVAVVDARDECFDGRRLLAAGGGVREAAFEAEMDSLGDAAPGRRQEFARSRICAHAAIAALGLPPRPILMGPRREPRWPAGLVGSITHCPGYRAAAVAAAADVLAVGVDAEPDRPLSPEVARLAFTDTDRAESGPLTRFRNWDRVAFSARESAFKAWFAVTGRWLDFADATLALQPDDRAGGCFSITIGEDVAGAGELLQAYGTAVLTGRFRWAPQLVLTAVTLRRPPSDAAPRASYPAGHHPR